MLIFHPPNRFSTRTKALPLCLTKKEIRELTLKMHHSAQVRTLAEMGIRFIVRPDGSPVVLHTALDTTQGTRDKAGQPDFSSLEF